MIKKSKIEKINMLLDPSIMEEFLALELQTKINEIIEVINKLDEKKEP